MKSAIISLFFLSVWSAVSQSPSDALNKFGVIYRHAFHRNILDAVGTDSLLAALRRLETGTGEHESSTPPPALADILRSLESLRSNPPDSVCPDLYAAYLGFTSRFHDRFEEEFMDQKAKKLLFLTTSLSCDCTMRMCRKQLAEVIEYARNNDMSFLVEDTRKHTRLMERYGVEYIPTILVLDGSNAELSRYVRDSRKLWEQQP